MLYGCVCVSELGFNEHAPAGIMSATMCGNDTLLVLEASLWLPWLQHADTNESFPPPLDTFRQPSSRHSFYYPLKAYVVIGE